MNDWKPFLATVPGFDRLDETSLERVASLVEARAFADGERLMRRGDDGDCMHVIVEGRARVPVTDDTGAELLVTTLGPREFVGEMALLSGEPRNRDVFALGDTRTLVLHRPAVEELLHDHPTLARFLAEILASRLGQHNGIRLIGKYRLEGRIGAGTNGSVYRAVHPTLGRVVAVKMLSHDLVHQPGFRARFIEEARTLAGLSHGHIVDVYDIEEAFGTLFIVMELVDGTDLDKLLVQRGRLAGDEIARLLLPVADALAYAHERGISHRDIKPANVAVEKSGRVKLMDFGLARMLRDDPASRVRTIDGTPQYIAPEVARGQVGDGRVDVYALGVMAFQMATGRPPFESDTVAGMLRAHVKTPPPDVATLAPELPPGLVTFIRGALVKAPEERLSDWAEIRRLLSPGAPPRRTPYDERLVRLRCRPSVAARVDEALAELRARLAADGVEVSVARFDSEQEEAASGTLLARA